MEDIQRERDFFKSQCNALGGRLLRLQQEIENARREARIVRTNAALIHEMYELTSPELPLDQIGKRFLQILLDKLGVYGAALLEYGPQEKRFVASYSLGFPSHERLSFSLSDHGIAFDVLTLGRDLGPVVNVLRESTGVPFIALAFEARAQLALMVGNLMQARHLPPFSDQYFQETLDSALSLFINIVKLRRTQEALRVSEERYRLVVNNANEGILVAQDGMLKFFNPKILELSGRPDAELLNGSFIEFVHPDDRPMVLERHLQRLRGENPPNIYALRIIVPKGEIKWLEINVVPFLWDNRPATLSFLSDITQRKRNEAQIEASLAAKEILLREIHHRVKNNLQVIFSLLYLQSLRLTDEQALRSLEDSQNRIKSMALVHENLYRSDDLARIDFARYTDSLTQHLVTSYGLSVQGVNLITKVEKVSLSTRTAIPCGLLLNELVSNSLKHAFPDGRQGDIYVELTSDRQGHFVLVVRDNGIGLPPDFQLTGHQSLGLQLVDTLVKQIDGTIEFDAREGAEFRISFSESESEEPENDEAV